MQKRLSGRFVVSGGFHSPFQRIHSASRLASSVSRALLCLPVPALPPQLLQQTHAIDLHAALDCLGEVTGDRVDEKLLDSVFSRFCVGK